MTQPSGRRGGPAAKRPAWQVVRDTVLRMIDEPAFAPGDRIPSERQLSEQLGLSRMTVRRGVEELVLSGVLERDSTSGTRIAHPRIIRQLDTASSFSMSEVVSRAGATPGGRLLFFESARATGRVARGLAVEPDSALFLLRRLRTADGVPFCVETSYLPAARVPGLAADDLIGNASLYALLRNRYGIRTARRRGEISVAAADPEDAELLGLPYRASVLLYRSTISDSGGVPIEYMISINHPDHVVFTTEQALAP
jgi:GntR family transcriptional regulator